MEADLRVIYRPSELKSLQRTIASQAALGLPRTVVLELNALETLDVAAVRGLITLLRDARAAGVDLVLHTSKPAIRRVLAVTALDRVFRIDATEEAAA